MLLLTSITGYVGHHLPCRIKELSSSYTQQAQAHLHYFTPVILALAQTEPSRPHPQKQGRPLNPRTLRPSDIITMRSRQGWPEIIMRQVQHSVAVHIPMGLPHTNVHVLLDAGVDDLTLQKARGKKAGIGREE